MYNSAPFIERCLYSCINQDISNDEYEIIVIDDGSSDNCAEIANLTLIGFKNHKIIVQPNKGLSVARNIGFEHSIGDYIWFVDADDTIEENCLNYIRNTCNSSACEILSFCADRLTNEHAIKIFDRVEGKLCRGKEYICSAMPVCVPFSIYQRFFLRNYNLHFVPGILHEDAEFTPRAYFFAKKVISSSKILYHVIPHRYSITATPNIKRSQDIFNVVLKSLDHLYSIADSKYRPGLASLIATDFNYALRQGLYLESEEICHLNKLAWDNRQLRKYFMLSSLSRHKLCGIIYYIFPLKMGTLYRNIQLFFHDRISRI